METRSVGFRAWGFIWREDGISKKDYTTGSLRNTRIDSAASNSHSCAEADHLSRQGVVAVEMSPAQPDINQK